jgi:UrcA family protein
MKTFRITVIALTLTTALPAFAQSLDEEPARRTVSYADLDLASSQGIAKLYTRIRLAAHSVCKDLQTLELGTRRSAWKICVHGAITAAVADVNSPMLTTYASTKLGSGVKSVALASRK